MTIIKKMRSNCPSCGKVVEKSGFMSFNYSNTNLYSDGNKQGGEDLDFASPIVSCFNCKEYFFEGDIFSVWFNSVDESDEEINESEVGSMYAARVTDIYKLLESKNSKFIKDAFNLYKYIIQCLNQVFLSNGKLYNYQKEIYYNSIDRTIEILESKEVVGKSESSKILFLAELYRYQEEYEKSLEILNTINNREYRNFVTQLKEACKQKIKNCIIINK